MADRRSRRPTIRVRLDDSAVAYHAEKVVSYWRGLRQAGPNVAKALALYYALMEGDVTLLEEYFPRLFYQLRGSANGVVPAPPPMPKAGPAITVQAKTVEQNDDDLLDGLFG